MSTINAQTIINEVMQAHAIAPTKQGEYRNEYACFWPKFAPWGFEDLNEPDGYYKSSSGSAHSALIYDLMTEATSEINDLCMVANKIKFQTSAKGSHTILNCKENLQRFADLVRRNAAAFGGGIVKTFKPRASVSWPAQLINLFKQSIEDKDYQAALDTGDRLGALFFVSKKGEAYMQVAPVPCDFDSRVVSACNENGTFAVTEPVSMCSLPGLSYVQKKNRAAEIQNVKDKLDSMPTFDLDAALIKQTSMPIDQAAARAQWITEHGLNSEAIEARIDAHETEISEAHEIVETISLGDRFEAELAKRKAAREAEAEELARLAQFDTEQAARDAGITARIETQRIEREAETARKVAFVARMDAEQAARDVAQVVAHAVAAVAISEAMQPSEAPILSTLDQFLAAQKEKMTCIRYAQTSRVMHSRVKYDGEIMQAHEWVELLIQSEGRKTEVKKKNKLQDMTRLQSHRANNEEQQAHEKRVKLAGTKTVYYAQNEAGSMVELSFTEYLYAQFLEAMQPSEALELVTCEAGENEAQAQSIGSTTGNTPAWSAMAEYVPCSPIKTGFGDAPKPAFSGGFDGENDKNVPDTPPMESGATPTPRPAVSDAEKRKQWQGFAHDIPASLAISAYNGV